VEVGLCHSRPRRARSAQALVGADVFFGVSVKGAMTQDMVEVRWRTSRSSLPWPSRSRDHGGRRRRGAFGRHHGHGRSDYPNQINNVLGFPYIFRGALDVRARAINMEMKIAAAHALAELAREDVPD